MDFKQIEAFINVARFKSFSKAAEAIYLSQPTISMHIIALENELGVSLFDRSGRDIQLTPSGALFYDYALNMLNIRDQAVRSIADFYDKIEGSLHIASSTTPCRYVLPRLIKDFSAKYPDVVFQVSEVSSGGVISNILKFDAELGIVGNRLQDERFVYSELTEDNLVLITPPDGKFKNLKGNSVKFKDLESEYFIMRENSSATRQLFESALLSAGYSPDRIKVLCEVSSMDTVLQFVKQGLGVSVISEKASREYIESGFVRRFYIEDLYLSRKIYLVRYAKKTLTPAARAFEAFAMYYFNKPENS